MRGALERLEAVDLEDVVDPAGQYSTDARDRAEEPLGVERAPQPLEQAPAAGGEDFVDGGRDARADAGQPRSASGPPRVTRSPTSSGSPAIVSAARRNARTRNGLAFWRSRRSAASRSRAAIAWFRRADRDGAHGESIAGAATPCAVGRALRVRLARFLAREGRDDITLREDADDPLPSSTGSAPIRRPAITPIASVSGASEPIDTTGRLMISATVWAGEPSERRVPLHVIRVHDPHEPGSVVEHGEIVDPVQRHEPQSLGEGRATRHRDGGPGHSLLHRDAVRPCGWFVE